MINGIMRSPELAKLLYTHQEAIATAGAEIAHALPDCRYSDFPPEQVRTWFHQGVEVFAESLNSGSLTTLENHLNRIGRDRLQMGFKIGEIIEGLLILRETAWRFIWETRSAGLTGPENDSTPFDTVFRYALHRFSNLYTSLMQARVKEATQRRIAELESLRKVTTALLQERSLDDLFEEIFREARQLTGAEASGLFLLEDETWLRAANNDPELTPPTNPMPLVGTFTGQAVRTGKPVLVNDYATRLSETRAPNPSIVSLLTIPLRVEGQAIGTLDVANKPGGFLPDDIHILSLFADVAAIAIETARLHVQSRQLIVAEERSRLARELHDSTTQAIYGVTLYAEAARLALAAGQQPVALDNLNELYGMAREAMIDMRMLIFELRPPILEQEGLVPALQARLAVVENRAGIQASIISEGKQELPLFLNEELYAITLEALTNVVKHAEAQHVTITLQSDDQRIRLQVKDDGHGFDLQEAQDSGGLGLRGIEERVQRINGHLEVTSVPEQGTTIQVEVIHQE